MIEQQKVVVVLPAYNAERTLSATLAEIPAGVVDDVVLVDDASSDDTADLARELGLEHVLVHDRNRGYGANQKTCYAKALSLDADIVVMLHPDYQYTPRLIPAMAGLVASGQFQAVLGSRILGGGALAGGMPMYKYVANRLLTAFQNFCTGAKLSEYHTGYRAFSRTLLEQIDFASDSDDFLFDNQMLARIIYSGERIGEITCPTKYFPEASSINFRRSVRYGLGVVSISTQHLLARIGLYRARLFRS